jgi:probable HAF family extracellular repeat protein
VGFAINDQGQIVGQVVSADGTTAYAALWQNGAITNLGTLPGDFGSYASGINNQGQVLGTTFDSSGTTRSISSRSMLGHSKGRVQNPTGDSPSEGSSARIQDTNSHECREMFSQPAREFSQVVTGRAGDAHQITPTVSENLIGSTAWVPQDFLIFFCDPCDGHGRTAGIRP